MSKICRELIESEARGDPGFAPGFRARLEPSDEQFPGVLLEVRAGIGIPQDRKPRGEPADRLRHDIKVFGRMKRYGGIRPAADLARPHAGAVHNDIRADLARLRGDPGDPAVLTPNTGDADLFQDAHPAVACATGECLRRIDGIGLPVFRQKYRSG
jgi:hypothetical protein